MTPRRGLRGVGVAVTRPESPGRLGAMLRAVGAAVVHWPCIRFAPPVDEGPLADAVRRLDAFDWLIVTSPRAARAWLDACERAGVGRGAAASAGGAAASPGGAVPIAATGPATAAVLREAGWAVRRIPDTYSAEGLLEAFEAQADAAGARVLFPCSDRAGDVLPDGLRRLGAVVESVVAYRTIPSPPDAAAVREAVESGGVRVVTFTSPSTVEAFLAGVKPGPGATSLVPDRLAAAAIGPTTAAALARHGWPAEVADEATLGALVRAASRAAAAPGGRPARDVRPIRSAHAAEAAESRSDSEA